MVLCAKIDGQYRAVIINRTCIRNDDLYLIYGQMQWSTTSS